ncbi:Zn-dependent M28 family amino/carboxypeptidase [Kineococcus xinjiangensis]|uniref:Zn-dependent M28 family amino/carboxypeptidase n=1 Tax=Kineococcus xinjiangensis TaxID=512762 RepID=A0A2S6IW96_9ACTN|nr:M28 family metallopeptidase [Kineococcus xinjiangensis]PPK98639.1 Zn-dependent M28 family amino/carboxypeptidase [Kineococcus xinjiangensis]
MRRTLALSAAAVTASAVLIPTAPAMAVDEVNTKRLRKAVTINGMLAHLRAFQRIANQNGGTRASGTPGYDQSVQYVKRRLEIAGYDVTVQAFDFPFFQATAEAELAMVTPEAKTFETATFDYSGSGDVTAAVQGVDLTFPPPGAANSTTSGCEASDFAGFTAGNVALIQRGTCPFGLKAANAAAAGASAVIIFNEGQEGRQDVVSGTLGAPADLPVVGMSYADAQALNGAVEQGPTTVRVFTETISEVRETYNVLADSRTGDPEKTIVVGAHLDSVAEGPGINDNGSGTAAILEIAEEMAELNIKNKQRVRFAFWGAEEKGLLGAEHYVEHLTDDQLGDIYANLNFDMLGSPNYVRFVYDGNGDSSEAAPEGPPGSGEIEDIFTNYFDARDMATVPTDFDGRSDYGPFIAAGIPAGGLFSGAEGIKTVEQAEVFGGEAGVAYDPCYHEACDDITNISTKALGELGDAAAHATMVMAVSRTGLYEDLSRRANRAPAAQSYDSAHGHPSN